MFPIIWLLYLDLTLNYDYMKYIFILSVEIRLLLIWAHNQYAKWSMMSLVMISWTSENFKCLTNVTFQEISFPSECQLTCPTLWTYAKICMQTCICCVHISLCTLHRKFQTQTCAKTQSFFSWSRSLPLSHIILVLFHLPEKYKMIF